MLLVEKFQKVSSYLWHNDCMYCVLQDDVIYSIWKKWYCYSWDIFACDAKSEGGLNLIGELVAAEHIWPNVHSKFIQQECAQTNNGHVGVTQYRNQMPNNVGHDFRGWPLTFLIKTLNWKCTAEVVDSVLLSILIVYLFLVRRPHPNIQHVELRHWNCVKLRYIMFASLVAVKC